MKIQHDPADSWRHNAQIKADLILHELAAGNCLENQYCVCPVKYINKKDRSCTCPCHGDGDDLI